MKQELIQTLHPQEGKTNKKIALDKYTFIRENLLNILVEFELAHTELVEELFSRIKDNFKGGVQWYGETVKLDLEARKIIERTKTKPEEYILTKTTKQLTGILKKWGFCTKFEHWNSIEHLY